MGLALMEGSTNNYTQMLQTIDESKLILTKFKANFFIKDLMDEANDKKREPTEAQKQMDQSFYRKEGLDFLYFQRPGTAYGKDFP